MIMKVIQEKVLSDNYSYVIVCEETNQAACIDTPDAQQILKVVNDLNLDLVAILNTHHHWDHAGGNEEVLSHFSDARVYCSQYDFDYNRIKGVTNPVKEGDVISVGHLRFTVVDVPGHTLGHIAYYGEGSLFCGDALFVSGCGRLFEGAPEQMYKSLNKLKKLNGDTKIYCAHEYTLKNLNFAESIGRNKNAVEAKLREAKQTLQKGLYTVPTRISEELQYNPFLTASSAKDFASLRAARDVF